MVTISIESAIWITSHALPDSLEVQIKYARVHVQLYKMRDIPVCIICTLLDSPSFQVGLESWIEQCRVWLAMAHCVTALLTPQR